MQTVKYRLFEPRLSPRRTKIEVPGWGGKSEPRRDGSHQQAWHLHTVHRGRCRNADKGTIVMVMLMRGGMVMVVVIVPPAPTTTPH